MFGVGCGEFFFCLVLRVFGVGAGGGDTALPEVEVRGTGWAFLCTLWRRRGTDFLGVIYGCTYARTNQGTFFGAAVTCEKIDT